MKLKVDETKRKFTVVENNLDQIYLDRIRG